MDKAEHAARLRAAMGRAGIGNEALADAVGKKPRTVTYWRSGSHMPDERDRHLLRQLLGPYDDPGDAVEAAVKASELTEDRQHDVLGLYKRLLREQHGERSA